MQTYLLILLLLSLFFAQLEMRDCKAENQAYVFLLIAAHHYFQLLLFVTPFTSYFRNAPMYVWYMYLAIFTYLTVQNTMIHSKKSQSCVVSIYTNRKCDFPTNSALKDPMYYTGLNHNLHAYKQLYTFVVLGYIIYILSLFKKK